MRGLSVKKIQNKSFFLYLIGIISLLVSTPCVSFASVLPAEGDRQILQGQEQTSIESLGYIGTTYKLTAHNIIVHVKNVSQLDIWKASEANVSTVSPIGRETDKVTPFIDKSNLKAKVGTYKVKLGIREDGSVSTVITVFVVEGPYSTDGQTLLYGHDFQLTRAEKQQLTVEKVKKIAGIRAYDIASGQEITSEVEGNAADLAQYLQEDQRPVDQTFSVRKVRLTVRGSTLSSSDVSPQENFKTLNSNRSGKVLPHTGEREDILYFVGVLFIFLFLFFAHETNRKEK